MKNDNLELLSSALRAVGGNFDVPTLDLILSVKALLDEKGEAISLGDINVISGKIARKYGMDRSPE